MLRSLPIVPRVLGALAVTALATSGASAQFARTGESTVVCGAGLCDANWSLSYYGISALTSGASGVMPNAALVTSPPSAPWAPNVAGAQQWVGVNGGATLQPNTGGNENNYRYFFQTTFTQPSAATLTFGIGWDNKLVGAFVGNVMINTDGSYDASGATALLGGISPMSPYAGGRSGFCRDADGVYPASSFPNCLVDLSLAVPASQAQTLTFVLQGDGLTDGFLAGSATATSTVPEPSSVALLSAGVIALGAFAARARYRQS